MGRLARGKVLKIRAPHRLDTRLRPAAITSFQEAIERKGLVARAKAYSMMGVPWRK